MTDGRLKFSLFQGEWLKRDLRKKLHALTAAVARAEPDGLGGGSKLTAMLSVHDPARVVKELEAELRVLQVQGYLAHKKPPHPGTLQ